MIVSDDTFSKLVHEMFPQKRVDPTKVIEPIHKPEPTKVLLDRIKKLRNNVHA